jgi:hypothetical protein
MTGFYHKTGWFTNQNMRGVRTIRRGWLDRVLTEDYIAEKGEDRMGKFIPFEKLSKAEKKKRNAAKRTVWTISPVTRKPDNPKAYRRSRRKDPINDEDPGPASFLLPEENNQKKYLKSQSKKVYNPEIDMLRFMTKQLHSKQSTKGSAK